jgi:CBS domain-containing protein
LQLAEWFVQRGVAMATTSQLTSEINQVLRELVSTRDEARLRAHLLGMDARQRLGDLEREIETFERRLSARGEWVAEHVIATARGLTRAISDLLGPRSDQEPARVRDAMTRDVVTCYESDSLNRAAQLMWDADCGALPVVSAEGKLIGMLTDRDICMAAYTRGKPLAELPVSGTMSTGLATCRPSDTLQSVMDLMSARQVRRMPVVDDDGRLVGILSLADLALLAQAPTTHSQEARTWLSGVLAGISEPPRATGRNGGVGPS